MLVCACACMRACVCVAALALAMVETGQDEGTLELACKPTMQYYHTVCTMLLPEWTIQNLFLQFTHELFCLYNHAKYLLCIPTRNHTKLSCALHG